MKHIILTILFISVIGFTFTSCQKKEGTTSQSSAPVAGAQYTCPMHPEVVKDAPGACPKCGMDLVLKK